MSSANKPFSKSVALAADKTRAQRVARIVATLDGGNWDPLPTVDALLAELGEGASHPELWEKLHASAGRDGKEVALADAYKRCTTGPRMKKLTPQTTVEVFMRAADYFQGMLGDGATAETFLDRVVTIMPTHTDAFVRLERRLEKALDSNRLLELYGKVAATPPRPVAVLATQSLNRALQLTPKTPLSDDACKQLMALVPTNARILDVLEAHCCATKRHALACVLIETCLRDPSTSDAVALQRRKRLLQLYLGEAANPTEAIVHVEEILKSVPTDQPAFEAGEKLLSNRAVASRAAAALATARRTRGF
jgi:hypothetical protein